MTPVSTHRNGSVAVVVCDSPPVNALGGAVRQGLLAALEAAERDADVQAIVLICRGKTFFAGADINEFGKPHQEPILPVLVDRIEATLKPVVAAIHGTALGGGLELALACHYRVAVASARLGLPEVKLGLIPGAGGTQRLPRLTGVEAAIEMVANGEPIGAASALAAGLIDRVVVEPLEDAAVTLALEKASVRPLPRTSERRDRLGDIPAATQAVAQFRARSGRKLRGRHAPELAIRAIEASVAKPYAEGLKVEHDLFWELMNGSQSQALQYLFFAERKAAKLEGMPDGVVERPVSRVGIVGAGTMGTGIAMNFLNAGIPTRMVDATAQALERGRGLIAKTYERDVEKGRLSQEGLARNLALLTSSIDLATLADCDLVIEAVFEEMPLKQDVFRRLDRICRPGAILASNTSFLSIDELATQTSRPGDVLGMHFFSPAHVMKLLEVVRGARTAPDALLTAMKFARTIGKVPVVAGVCHGFIGNRMLMPMVAQTDLLILEGASPGQIDGVHMEFGLPMGPFRTADLAGIDLGWHRDPSRADDVREALCAVGRWGQKTKKGYYDYDDNRNPTPSEEVRHIIDRFRAKAGFAQRQISEAEILERSLYVIVNEGAKVLEEGIAQRASDIDVVWTYGYGWPRHKGGPMFWADLEGVPKILAGLERLQAHLGKDLGISQLLRDVAVSGKKISTLSAKDLNR